jgi:tetratricopeptide (TPR) repeat protein
MSELDKALELCNKNKFDDALPILEEITKNDPQNSEAWRTMAQIHWFHLHQPDKAYDELIEALRCEPTNLWALILMGNLLTKEKNDIDGAKTYYDKVLEYHPNNAIAINNVAATYMERKDYDSAIPLMEKVISIDDTYIN